MKKNIREFNYGLLLLMCMCIGLSACTKQAGEGGLARISGKVYAFDYDKQGYLKAEGYAGDVRVYISVDGSNELLDDVRTTYDGSFTFPFLRKGNYKVWVYTQCDSCINDMLSVVQDITIGKRKEEIVLPDFEIKM